MVCIIVLASIMDTINTLVRIQVSSSMDTHRVCIKLLSKYKSDYELIKYARVLLLVCIEYSRALVRQSSASPSLRELWADNDAVSRRVTHLETHTCPPRRYCGTRIS